MSTRIRSRILFLVTAAALVAAVALLPAAAPQAAPRDKTTKIVKLTCKNGWRGTALGEYGGVPLSISCNYDRATTTLSGTAGTAYVIRVGVETFGGAVDCFFPGDSPRVNESCGGVRLSIR